jgi:hypothetical protein
MNTISRAIENELKTKKVKVIAHSQGGVIINDIIQSLTNRQVDVSNLEVFTFASASDVINTNKDLYQEHFCNEFDFVCRIGPMSDKNIKNLYLRKDGYGHFINKSYLTAFMRGDYCDKKSKLFSYL